MRITGESTCRLPYKIVEVIIAYLTYDLSTLKACALTRRSWYIAAAPHIYDTFVLGGSAFGTFRSGLDSLSSLHELGLIPLVKEIRLGRSGIRPVLFRPEVFPPSALGYFSTFNNVHTLRIQGLDVDRFMPVVEYYFQQFSPTLRSISLHCPTFCAPQQLSHFLSLFPNLEDVDIRWPSLLNTTAPDTELVPFSAPEFRGLLALYSIPMVETWTHLIDICGVLRFHHMDLREVECRAILLEACAETLETLRFYMADNLC